MRKIAAWLWCLCIGQLAAVGATETNVFKMTIEGEPCVVHAYQDEPAMPLPTWFDSRPDLSKPWLIQILCSRSNLTTFLSNDEIRALYAPAVSDAQIAEMREDQAKRCELTRTSAAENPWRGMVQSLASIFVIESARGKILLHQTTSRLVAEKDAKGQAVSALIFVDGKWKIGKVGFGILHLDAVCDEFAKLKAEGKVAAKPFDALN